VVVVIQSLGGRHERRDDLAADDRRVGVPDVGVSGPLLADAAGRDHEVASWSPPHDPTRRNVSAPARASSSSAIVADGAPIPVEVTDTGVSR